MPRLGRKWLRELPEGVTIHNSHVRRGVKTREDDEQETLFLMLDHLLPQYPILRFIYHVPNQGNASIQRGAKLRRMGVRSGVWDIGFDQRGHGGASLRIEMKVGTNGLSDTQMDWGHFYSISGFRMAVCYSAQDALDVIREYCGV